MDDQLTREFLAESEELVEGLYADLELLRARREDGRGRRELVGRLFRRAHTLKGTASAAGLDPAAEVAHEFESLLDAVRLGHAVLSDAVLDAFEEAASAVSSCLGAASRGEHVEAPRAPLERLRALAAPQAGAEAKRAPSAAGVALPEELARSLTEFERQRLREAVEEGARVFVVVADFDLTDFDEQFRRLSDALGERGEVVSTLPGVEAGAPDRVRFRVLHATDEEAVRLSERVAAFGAAVQECAREPAGEGAHVGEGAAAPAEPAAPMSHPALTVRVSLEELDGLLAAAHELFAETAAALDESERARRVRARSAELEARLTALRMVPVRATLERAARAGRSAARAVGKEVEIELAGGDVRLDKSLAEAVADPLLHLLRNAVDHGIETPEERIAAGKPRRGRVRVEAGAEGGSVVLRVSDDGRGVDAARVASAARGRGLVAEGAEVSKAAALRLIFRPGFSTAAALSSLSGRGVGLDVVERAAEQAGGEVRVSTEPGRGTTFEMRLPSSLALIASLVVGAGGNRYCLDARQVLDSGHAAPGDLTGGGEGESVVWDGATLRLVRLSALLGQPREEISHNGSVPVVITRDGRGEARVAVAVDYLGERVEALVRGLGRHAARWRGVSGAAELSDGTVALLLDLPPLLEAGD